MNLTELKTQTLTEHPQTVAEIMDTLTKEHIHSIAKYGCCAFSLLWALGFDISENVKAVEILSHMIDAKVIGNDCTVYWKDAVKYLTGKDSIVEFKQIQNANELKSISGRCVVRFDNNGFSHWVGVENGEVVYNSLKDSKCVRYGRPTTARIIHLV